MNFINKYILFIFYFFLFVGNIQSQNKGIDSLQNQLLHHTQKDTIRVKILNDLAYLYFKKGLANNAQYVDESWSISDSLGFIKGKAKSLAIKGIIFSYQSNFAQGSQYLIEAIQLYKTINYKRGLSSCYNNLGVIFYRKRDYKASIVYYLKSIKIKEEIGDKKDVINGLLYIGRAHVEIGKYAEGIDYYTQALNISKKINNAKTISACLNGIGNIYSHQGNYPLAIEYYNNAMVIGKKSGLHKSICVTLINIGNVNVRLQNYDKAVVFYKKALEVSKKVNNKFAASILHNLGEAYKNKKNYKLAHKLYEDAIKIYKKKNNKPNVAISLNNIGAIYLELKESKKAYQYYEKAKKICLEVDNQRGLCSSYLGIAKVYTNQKKYDLALINALKSKEISTKLKLIDIQRDAQQLLSEIYKNIGNYKNAFSSHQQFKILNDSLFNKKNIEKITQLEYEYKYKKKLDSASVRELKLTKTVVNLENSEQNYLWAIISVLLVSILLGGVIFYLKLRNVKSEAQNIVIEQKLLRSQMTPHFIFNSLSVLQGMILNKEEKKSISYLSKFSKLLRIILENSRDKTVVLSQELTAVENYLSLQNLENESYKATIVVGDTINMSLFKIPPMLIQPFVENAIEHAFRNQKEKKIIEICLTYSNKQLVCTITDNGVGIDATKEKKNHKKSLSTTITSERLKMLSKDFKMEGSVTIKDRKKYNKQGTVVTLVIPYKIETVS